LWTDWIVLKVRPVKIQGLFRHKTHTHVGIPQFANFQKDNFSMKKAKNGFKNGWIFFILIVCLIDIKSKTSQNV
jgi:hypothetical protein